jgi:FkbM family methyltransferase
MTSQTVADHRGWRLVLKTVAPEWLFRIMTVLYNGALRSVPYNLKYSLGEAPRRRKLPYSSIEETDLVVQFGAPRDILLAGRSRAIHFARLASKGKVIVVEPDPDNCAALKAYIKAHSLQDRIVLVEEGAWNESGELTFLSSATHPAANVLVSAKEITDDLIRSRNYRKIMVPVNTGDAILERLGLGKPKLISITTNGAEPQIISGLRRTLQSRVPYISLAFTGSGYEEIMRDCGYKLKATDDRGFTFEVTPPAV